MVVQEDKSPENRVIKLFGSAFTAAILTLFGIVHAPNLGMHVTTIFWRYLMMTALFVAAWLAKIEKDPEIGELDFKGN